MANGNILLITIDQLRADIIDGALAEFVPLPNLRRFAAESVSFANHFTVTVPCGPARASLLTGMYAMNHRAIRNGTPLARHHATVATEARKAGYEPLLFGYSDATADPTDLDPNDPVLAIYEGVAPGFRELVEMRQESGLEWPAYLKARGYTLPDPTSDRAIELYKPVTASGSEPAINDPALYSAADSDTAYLTDRTLEALELRRHKPWFAHLTYIRPHPPLVAPAPYNRLIDPKQIAAPLAGAPDHGFMDAWRSGPSNGGLFWAFDGNCASLTTKQIAELRAVYLGLVAEVDFHIGRVLDWLDETDQSDNTLVIVTADHGEMLGDKGQWGKETVFDPAYCVSLIVRDPRQRRKSKEPVSAITESVDVAPTVLDWIGLPVPPAMDGQSLLPLIAGGRAREREAAFAEIDLSHPLRPTRFQKYWKLDELHCNAAIYRERRWKYVHFNGGVPAMLFDLEADPHETANLAGNPAYAGEVSRLARKMLDLRMTRADRRLTGYAFGA
jgi:arylsulfatase A-like enzyme